MHFINYNGKLVESQTAIIGADNRGLRFGDGLFETIKYKNDELILIDEHLARLWKGMQAMKFEIPKLLTPEHLQQQILQLISKNKQPAARVRLTILRGNGGLYDAVNHTPNYIIQSWQLPESNGTLNENGLQLCIYPDAKKMADSFSNLKHNNYLPYLMGALFAKERHCNDAVILNNHDRLCDSTIANIFIIKDGNIFTPSLSEGCVAGVIRKFIIMHANSAGFAITEKAITIEELLDADEVFLSNAIYNIRWVAAIDNKTYTNTIISKIFVSLQKTNAAVFC